MMALHTKHPEAWGEHGHILMDMLVRIGTNIILSAKNPVRIQDPMEHEELEQALWIVETYGEHFQEQMKISN